MDNVVDLQLLEARRCVLARLRAGRVPPDDAEDAASEAVLRALTSGSAARAAGQHLVAWLTTAARRCLVDAHRRAARDARAPVRAAPGSGAPDPAESAVLATLVARAWGGLSEGERTVLLMRAAGLTTGEAAAKLGVDPQCVKKRLYRARARLRQALGYAGVLPSPARLRPSAVPSLRSAAREELPAAA